MNGVVPALCATLFVLAASALAAAPVDKPELLRVYNYRDLAECVEQFKEREFFESIYARAYSDQTSPDKFILGILYQYGLGVPRDEVKAYRWYREAAEAGYRHRELGREADEALARLRAKGITAPKTAVPEPTDEERTAMDADAGEQLRLASRFWRGLCAPLDWEKAMEWELRAAANGDARAMQIVIDNYTDGNYAYPRDPSRVRAWLEEQTAAGNAAAATRLANLILSEAKGEEDYRRALELFEMGAKADNLAAWQGLMRMHSQGLGVERDEKKVEFLGKKLDIVGQARREMRESRPIAVTEYAEGIYRQGLPLYERGDYFMAGMTFGDAAGLGVEVADNYCLLGLIQEEGRCGEPNPYAAAKQYRTGALLGNAPSMLRLAKLHEEGRGVRRSLLQAEKWCKLAAEAGEPGADEALRAVRERLRSGSREQWETDPAFLRMMEDARVRSKL